MKITIDKRPTGYTGPAEVLTVSHFGDPVAVDVIQPTPSPCETGSMPGAICARGGIGCPVDHRADS